MSHEIRKLSADEVPLLLPGARAFFSEGGIDGVLNETHFVNMLSNAIRSNAGVCFTADFRGAIGGIFSADAATADLVCMEYFWYVAKEERGTLGVRLLKALEDECIERKAKRLFMMHLATEGSERIESLYLKRGFRLKEQVYVKNWSAP